MDRLVKFDLPSFCLAKCLISDWKKLHCDKCNHSKCSKDCYIDVLNRVVDSFDNAVSIEFHSSTSSFQLMDSPFPKLVLCRNDVNTIDVALELLDNILFKCSIEMHSDIVRVRKVIRKFVLDCGFSEMGLPPEKLDKDGDKNL